MSTTFLYIPFSADEKPEELLESAKSWEKVHKKKQDMKEILSEEEDPYAAKKIVICPQGSHKLEDIKEGDSVYILAHGMHGTVDVSHSVMSNEFTLSQKEVVNRAINDGLPENKEFKLKLFYCDEAHNALDRTNAFFEGISKSNKDFKKMDLQYYPDVILSSPVAPKEVHKAHTAYKKAMVSKNLLDANKRELEEYLKSAMDSMKAPELKEFLGSLGKEVFIKLMKNADINLLKTLQKKAEITNVNHFLSNLDNTQTFSIKLYTEVGKAKEFRKKF